MDKPITARQVLENYLSTLKAKLKPGVWVCMESLIPERHYGRPSEVTKVSGTRVYVRRPQRDKHGVIEEWTEGYKAITSIRLVAPSEAAAQACYDADVRLHTEYSNESAILRDKYHTTLREQVAAITSQN